MEILARDTGELRLPLCAMDAAAEGKLKETLQKYGLIR
jgi:hypothetical protein